MTTSTHTITADIHGVTTQVKFTYKPDIRGPDLHLNCFTADRPITCDDVNDWLQDEGFFIARDFAEHERHGNYK